MPLSDPRSLFGIHSFLAYRLGTRIPYGPILKVLQSSGVNLTADFEDLTGGSERFVLASEPKLITTEITLVTRDYRDFLFELFTGATITQNTAEAAGNLSTAANVKGTSAIDGTTGIATVTVIPVTGAADLKFGKVVISVISATDINLLYSSDIDFARGTDGAYENDELEVLSVDLTIPDSSATVDATDFGLRFTGGSGTVAMTIGDTAEFDVRPINDGNSVIDIGSSISEFPEFGVILYAQKRGNGEMFEIELFRCIGAGLPMSFEEKVFAQAEITIKGLKDFALDKVMQIRAITF